jgi:hypothetical protein
MTFIEPPRATHEVFPTSVEIRHEHVEFVAQVFDLSIAVIEGENFD